MTMKKVSLPALLCALFLQAGVTFGKTFSFDTMTQFYPGKSAQALKSIILDYPNTCSSCKYYLPNINWMQILQGNANSSQLIVFENVAGMGGVGGSEAYRIVNVEDSGSLVTISSFFPDKSNQKKFRKAFGYKHDSPFDNISVTWKFQETTRDGQSGTMASYDVYAEGKWYLPRGMVESKFIEAAKQMFKNLQ